MQADVQVSENRTSSSAIFMAVSMKRINNAWHRNQSCLISSALQSAGTILAFTSNLYSTTNTKNISVSHHHNQKYKVIRLKLVCETTNNISMRHIWENTTLTGLGLGLDYLLVSAYYGQK